MADMVEAGVTEVQQPEVLIPQGHGVEAHLAHAQLTHDGSTHSTGNVISHKLHIPLSFDDPASSDPAVSATSLDSANDSHDLTDSEVHQHHKAGLKQPNLLGSADDLGTIEDKHIVGSKQSEHVSGAHTGIFGHRDTAQPKTIGFDTAVSQLFSFGIPFAMIFAVAAVMLWKRLGDLQPLTAHEPPSGL